MNADNYKMGDKIGTLTLIQEIPATYEGSRQFTAACKCGNLTHTTLFGRKLDEREHKACRTCKDCKVYAEGAWSIFKREYKIDSGQQLRTKAKEQVSLIGDFFEHTHGIGFAPLTKTIFVYFEKKHEKQMIHAEDSRDLWMPIVKKIVDEKTFVWFTNKLELETWKYFVFNENP